jgi:putative endonuclease
MTGSLKTLASGKHAEQTACTFLQQKGLTLLQSNYRCKSGEIDLIMQDPAQEIIFVEVRLRNNTLFGSACESVDFFKQQKIIKAATHYLQMQNWLDKVNCRFDVIGISYKKTMASVEWITDAFSADNF